VASGVTSSGNTKTLNLATGGAANSTTNINIGSNTGTVNLKLNHLTSAQAVFTDNNNQIISKTVTGQGSVVLANGAYITYPSIDSGSFTGQLSVQTAITSSNTTTGSLVVAGGAGIQGTLFANNIQGVSGFQLGTPNSSGSVKWFQDTGLDSWFGIYEPLNSLYFGISTRLPSPSGTSTLGGYYKGLGIGGSTNNTNQPIFGILNSGQSGNGLGSVAFTIYDTNKVLTYTNTLDDGSGNMIVAATTDTTNATSGALTVRGGVGIAKSLYVGGNTTVIGILNLTGNTTSNQSIATAATTGALNIYTGQTTGALDIGGNTTSSTGTITVGRSLGNQTINIGNGIAASGNTKTINIGTNGASGSVTNVNIGSATAGALNSLRVNGNMGINIAASNTYQLQVNGAFAATTKSFVIPHPTKPGKQLRYGSLEGPENGVYIRGTLKGNKIELPDYWTKLVNPDSITVDLTPIGKHQKLFVEDITDNIVIVGNGNMLNKEINCFYIVYAERNDVDKLEVEI